MGELKQRLFLFKSLLPGLSTTMRRQMAFRCPWPLNQRLPEYPRPDMLTAVHPPAVAATIQPGALRQERESSEDAKYGSGGLSCRTLPAQRPKIATILVKLVITESFGYRLDHFPSANRSALPAQAQLSLRYQRRPTVLLRAGAVTSMNEPSTKSFSFAPAPPNPMRNRRRVATQPSLLMQIAHDMPAQPTQHRLSSHILAIAEKSPHLPNRGRTSHLVGPRW